MQNIIKLSAAVHELLCTRTFLLYLATVKNLKIRSCDHDLWSITLKFSQLVGRSVNWSVHQSVDPVSVDQSVSQLISLVSQLFGRSDWSVSWSVNLIGQSIIWLIRVVSRSINWSVDLIGQSIIHLIQLVSRSADLIGQLINRSMQLVS